jgi:hypothetical protein
VDNRKRDIARYVSLRWWSALTTNNNHMKKFEVGSFLTERDYTKKSNIQNILFGGALAIAAVVAFVVPLLN